VVQREFSQHSLALGSHRQQHFPPVFISPMPPDIPASREPVHQLDRAVMLNEQPGRQLANGRLDTFRQPLHGEQQLMLLRLDAEGLCGRLAEMKELPDLAPEFGQVPVLFVS